MIQKTLFLEFDSKKNEVSQQKKDAQNLFSNTVLEISTKVYLLPEFKKSRLFLKLKTQKTR
jgi:hypothetical protein